MAAEISEAVKRNRGCYSDDDRLVAVVCSLTRAAALEAAGRDTGLPKSAVGTVHALCFRGLGRPLLVNGSESSWNEHVTSRGLPGAWELTESGHRGEGFDASESEVNAASRGDMLRAQVGSLRARMCDTGGWPAEALEFWRQFSAWMAANGLCDFTDLLERARTEVLVCPGEPETIYLDEAQDASRLILSVVRNWAAHCNELVIVGDPHQSIYGFADAYPEMFWSEKLTSVEVLEQSHRVPVAVHKAATSFLMRGCGITTGDPREFRYRPTGLQGAVSTCAAKYRTPGPAVDLAAELSADGSSVMLMGTCAYIVRPTVSMMRDRGMAFSNPWRPPSAEWNPLRRKDGAVTGPDAVAALLSCDEERPWTFHDLHAWTSRCRAKGLLVRGARKRLAEAASQEPSEYVHVEDLGGWLDMREGGIAHGIVKALLRGDAATACGMMLDAVMPRYEKSARYASDVAKASGRESLWDEPRIHVGTVHSFKGGEADHVIVFPDLSATAYAHAIRDEKSAHESIRVGYVAMTRARRSLHVCLPSSHHCLRMLG